MSKYINILKNLKNTNNIMYRNIKELPLRVYEEILLSDDLSLLKCGDDVSNDEVIKVWDDIQEELFNLNKLSDKKKNYLKSKDKYIKYMIDYFLNGNRFSKTLANIEEVNMKTYSEDESSYKSMLTIVVEISSILKLQLNYNTLTVGEFYDYLKVAEQYSKIK